MQTDQPVTENSGPAYIRTLLPKELQEILAEANTVQRELTPLKTHFTGEKRMRALVMAALRSAIQDEKDCENYELRQKPQRLEHLHDNVIRSMQRRFTAGQLELVMHEIEMLWPVEQAQ